MRNKYKNIGKFIICLKEPEYGGAFTVGEKYKLLTFNNRNPKNLYHKPWEVVVENNFEGIEIFNIHSSFGNCFCSLSYLRNKKLKKLRCNQL